MSRGDSTLWQRFTLGMLCVSPFFFPLYLLRFKVVGVPFTVLELFTYLLFAAFLLGCLRGQFKLEWRGMKGYYVFALMLLLGSILGVVLAPHEIILPGGESIDPQMISMGVLKGWILAPLLYFFTLTQLVKNSIDLKKILLSFIASGALVALVSYFFGIFGTGFTPDLRLAGVFESANYLSLYLAPAFLLGLYYLSQKDFLTKSERLLSVGGCTIMAHALFMSQSYAAILAIFGAIGFYVLRLLFRKRGNLKQFFGMLILLLALLAGLIASQFNTPKFQQFLDWENRSSTSVRLEIYQVSLTLIKDHPLTGIGPGLFQAYYQTNAPLVLGQVPLEWNMPHPHNIFLAFWLNAGLLGFLAFLGFLFLAHRKFTYPLIAFWGILIHGLFDVPFWKNDLAMIFWLILGAIVVLQIQIHQEKKFTL